MKENNWISVKDRLPEENINVLTATILWNQIYNRILYLEFDTSYDKYIWMDDIEEVKETEGPDYWMFIPDYPRQEG